MPSCAPKNALIRCLPPSGSEAETTPSISPPPLSFYRSSSHKSTHNPTQDYRSDDRISSLHRGLDPLTRIPATSAHMMIRYSPFGRETAPSKLHLGLGFSRIPLLVPDDFE